MRYLIEDPPVIGIATAGNPFFGGITGAWVDCIECDRRDRITGDEVERMTDDEIAVVFHERGWTILPTRCPTHAGHDREGEE